MRRPPHTRLSLEPLENRSCLSVYAHLVGGSLVVSGSTIQLTVTEVADGVFRLGDDQTVRGQFRVSKDVELRLSTRNSDRVTLNLNHHATPGTLLGGSAQDTLYVERTAGSGHNVWAWLGSGADSAKLRGSIRGNLNVFAGTGSDTVSLDGSALVLLGDGDNSFTLLGSIGMSLNEKEPALTVYTGMGKDTAAFAGNAVVNSGMPVNLGGGDDVVSFGDGFRATSGVIDGGMGTNGFYNFTPTEVRLVNFQFGVA